MMNLTWSLKLFADPIHDTYSFSVFRTEMLLNELNECPKSFDHAPSECRLVIRNTVDNLVTNLTDYLNFSQLGV